MLIQFTGLSGAGKTTLAGRVKQLLEEEHSLQVEIIDGDVYRKTICKDLGFSKEDRYEHIRRLAVVATSFADAGSIAVIAAINPFESIRNELREKFGAKTIWIKCDADILLKRDTKGLYKRALLPDDHPDKIFNFTGVNGIYEAPLSADLVIDTGSETEECSANKLYHFILQLAKPGWFLSFQPLRTIQMPVYNKKV